MDGRRRRIAVLGSTGSIGSSSLEVAARHADRLEVVVLAALSRWEKLAEQARAFRPRLAVIADPAVERQIPAGAFPRETELRFGCDAVVEAARSTDVDTVVSGIVGAAGLRSTWAALEHGKRVALANKETLVVAGPLVTELAESRGAELLPVDSEHSALFQSLQAGRKNEVDRLILTASGGPFRNWSAERIAAATREEALAHPTWNMGPKITIDSATMMNKSLEIIEARWLFGLPSDRISVVVHPQSIVHSMVEFVDGSVIAQLSPPDMKLPIQYALTYPDRWPGVSPRMDWSKASMLEFSPPDLERFPALELGFTVAKAGGTAGAVLNAANEVAVARFLDGDLKFPEIVRVCRDVLAAHDFELRPGLERLIALDRWARQESASWKS